MLNRNGKKFNVALLLSIFVGWLGIDRFYLGYPALGLYCFILSSKCLSMQGAFIIRCSASVMCC